MGKSPEFQGKPQAFLTPEKEVFAIVQGKVKFALWLSPEVKDVIEEHYREDNCKSRSEFIEKAILFYEGYLHTKKAANFLPRVLSDILNSTLGSFGNRIGKLMFKQAVEENISHHLLAADSDLDVETYKRLRRRSVDEVKATNGAISFEDDLIFQKSL